MRGLGSEAKKTSLEEHNVLTARLASQASRINELEAAVSQAGQLQKEFVSQQRELSLQVELYNELQEELKLQIGQHQALQAEYDAQQEKAERVFRELESLKSEYEKLQVEYNEWIELVEKD